MEAKTLALTMAIFMFALLMWLSRPALTTGQSKTAQANAVLEAANANFAGQTSQPTPAPKEAN